MLLGLRTQTFPVDDVGAAKAWYTKILGAGPYFDEPYYVGFNVAGYELGLVPKGDGDVQPRSYWGVPDAKAAVAELIEHGATLDEEIQDVGDGILVATVRDPSGHIFGVIENPLFAVAEVAGMAEAGPGR
jgi:predicted enzyme related to lactoylglutathione lyase